MNGNNEFLIESRRNKCFQLLVQLTVIGENGVHGAPARRHVNRESNQGNERAMPLLHCMVARNAKEIQARIKFAMTMSHAQVRCILCQIRSVHVRFDYEKRFSVSFSYTATKHLLKDA